jgi:deoxyribodipyrimidine photo-lyase
VPSVLWFRRDLRLSDHPALCTAAAEGAVVPLYVIDPALWDQSGAPRAAFLVASLQALGGSMGGRLVIRYGDPAHVVAQVAAEVGAREVYVTDDHSPFGVRRDHAVAVALQADGRHLVPVGSNYAVAPGTVVKDDGNPYAVFTPFSRAWLKAGWSAPLAAPDVQWLGDPDIKSLGFPKDLTWDIPDGTAGEQAAHLRLEAFVADALDLYDSERDIPSIEGTSRLGPHLRFGTIHPRQVLAELGTLKAHEVFRSELAWRDFYADVLWRKPHTAWENLQPKMARMPVDIDAAAKQRFTQWCDGQTGYPIIDAGMRQLRGTGFMHNRVRMIVASFLVKDLHLPWQWGAKHFMQHLLDGDIASNNHGWQWAAGTGTDAAPYFRVFNPLSQSERFDPSGAYIRQYVPELAEVPDREIHAPWMSKRGLPLGYVGPMVDHAVEREEALRRYAVVTGKG